jgi:hypothetical protein
MNEPPTLLIREMDDDRTLIDSIRLSDPDPAFEGSGRAGSSVDPSPSPDQLTEGRRSPWHGLHAKLSGGRRRLIEGGVVLALVLGLGSVAYQQWRTAAALREAINEIKTSRSVALADELVGLPGRALARVGTEQGWEASTREVAASDREELEHRGASLVGSNDFAGALAHYKTLTRLFPNETAFRDVVIVLRAKLRCADPAGPVSRECP